MYFGSQVKITPATLHNEKKPAFDSKKNNRWSEAVFIVFISYEGKFLTALLGYMAHGSCYLWNPGLVSLHTISDFSIAIAYFSIPIALVYFNRRIRAQIPHPGILIWFAAFIFSCGFGHLVDIWTIWFPNYWFSGLQRATTGLISIYTAFLMWPLIGKFLSFAALQEQTAMALQESEERFRLFMDNSPTVVFVKDTDGKYVYANALFQTLFGAQKDGITDFDYFSDEIAKNLRKNDAQVLETGKPLVVEEVAPILGGTARDWLSFKFRFTDSKGVSFVAGAGLDISDRKHSEAQLKDYADRLAASNEELSRFAYVASHDLKAPLRTIRNRINFLVRSLETPTQEVQHQVERITLATIRMEQLLGDLLNYSRVGTQARKLTPTDSQSVIAVVLESLESLILENRAVIHVQSNLPTVLADSTQLGQVFQNLISNGIKFCQDQPQIRISATCKTQECIFCVADNGIGIPTQYQQQIFEVFQRLHGRSEYEGSGVGLAIVNKVVHQHGGRIWVESKTDQGSQFFFTLKEATHAGKTTRSTD